MARVRGKENAATELRLIGVFRKYGITGWRRNSDLVGHPDFVFSKERLAVFVDGCFWHGCRVHGSIPKTNEEFWAKKISANRARDRRVGRLLRHAGWTVLRIWQHELSAHAVVARRMRKALAGAQSARPTKASPDVRSFAASKSTH